MARIEEQAGEVNMKEPTEEEIKRFWEHWGFKPTRLQSGNMGWLYPPEYSLERGYLPKIDLNNLFKRAVPKLQDINSEILIRFMFGSVNRSGIYQWTKKYSHKKNFEWLEMGAANSDDPALALFWAINKII